MYVGDDFSCRPLSVDHDDTSDRQTDRQTARLLLYMHDGMTFICNTENATHFCFAPHALLPLNFQRVQQVHFRHTITPVFDGSILIWALCTQLLYEFGYMLTRRSS